MNQDLLSFLPLAVMTILMLLVNCYIAQKFKILSLGIVILVEIS